jgi:ribonuclease HI
MKTGVGAGLLFISPLGEHMRYAVRLHFPASNNMAEYEALLYGLKSPLRRTSSASTLGGTRSS